MTTEIHAPYCSSELSDLSITSCYSIAFIFKIFIKFSPKNSTFNSVLWLLPVHPDLWDSASIRGMSSKSARVLFRIRHPLDSNADDPTRVKSSEDCLWHPEFESAYNISVRRSRQSQVEPNTQLHCTVFTFMV